MIALNLAEHIVVSMGITGVCVVALVGGSTISGISLDFFGGPIHLIKPNINYAYV